MELTTKIQVLVKAQTEKGEYCDALYFTPIEYDALEPSEIEALAEERVTAWVETVRNPPPVSEPTKEELEAQEAELAQQIEAIQLEKQERFGV